MCPSFLHDQFLEKFMQTNLFFPSLPSSIFSFVKLFWRVDSSLCVLASKFSAEIYKHSLVELRAHFLTDSLLLLRGSV